MNWEAIGAIGEILGAGAVVISLVYLAAQIKVQNREARAAAMHEISEGFRDSIGTMSNRDNAEVMARANQDFDSLSEAELIMLLSALQRVLRLWEEAFHQFEDGRLDAHIWEVIVRQYSQLLAIPSIKRVWELRKDFYEPKFREFVDSVPPTDWNLT